MDIRRVAIIYDDRGRPETTGVYCRRALETLVEVTHFLPDQIGQIPRHAFDLHLNVDDGLEYQVDDGLRPLAWWAIDTHLNFSRCLEKAKSADLVFTAQRNGAERLLAEGIAGAEWLALACDPEVHRKFPVEKTHDVTFIGHIFPGPRAQLLSLLERRFRKVLIGQAYFEEMARAYSASRAVFNRSLEDDINMRVFEALACGSLLVTNDLAHNGQETLFRDGIHLATYANEDELIDKIAYYLAHDAAREKIAAAGRALVLARHTYRRRMEVLLKRAETTLATLSVRPAGAIPTHGAKSSEASQHEDARRGDDQLESTATNRGLKTLIRNDQAVLLAVNGDLAKARVELDAILLNGATCGHARLNAALLSADLDLNSVRSIASGIKNDVALEVPSAPVRIAILSFLFNWPSTGGGTVHTFELAKFLSQSGYEVRHVFATYGDWGIGRVEGDLPYESESLDFQGHPWTLESIQDRFRQAVNAFDPDHVIITDSWNIKPLLAEAVRDYPYILRLQALECLCPLNNVRLLPEPGGGFRQCHLHQFASPAECQRCLAERGHFSGRLHQAERDLAGVGQPGYQDKLLRAFREAEAVLVVNPLNEAMLSPYSANVRVVTSGMDPTRFPWPPPVAEKSSERPSRKSILFAGLVDELMKGYWIVRQACGILWQKRQDFELVVTADPPEDPDVFARFIGWQTQGGLPARLFESDILVMPTIAQEALGRTAVEAMAAGRPVVASRIGGLQFTVADGATGLLCEPGNAEDLARKLEILLDDDEMRLRMGLAGRRRFEEHYAWEGIIDRHYRPLLKRRDRTHRTVAPIQAQPYTPFFPDQVDHKALVSAAAEFFGIGRAEAESEFHRYRDFHEAKGYARNFGEFKTLCFEEAFLLLLALSRYRPTSIAEVGTQHGKSTRRILDMAGHLGLGSRITCFDRVDEVRHFETREAELIVGDITGHFADKVLRAFAPGLIFLDIHEYGPLREALAEVLATDNCLLAIHDCGRGLCNPRMTIAKDDPNVTSLTGVWERHVLAELFGIDDPLGGPLDNAVSPTHRLRIFDTTHGLGFIVPNAMDFRIGQVLKSDNFKS